MTVNDRPDQLRYEIDDNGAVAGFIAYRSEAGTVDLVGGPVAPAPSPSFLNGVTIDPSFVPTDGRGGSLGFL